MHIHTIIYEETLDQISRHCPEAMTTYLQCIHRANDDGEVYFSKQMIDVDLSEEFPVFRRNIKKLARENILEWHPIDDGISITLAYHDDE